MNVSTARTRLRVTVGLATALLVLSGCGDEAPESPSPASPATTPSQGTAPTAEQLAAALVSADDYDGTWTVSVPPGGEEAIDGVVSDDQRAMIPRVELCDRASDASRSAAESLRWQAFRQLDQTEKNPIDMAGGDRSGHLVFVQEYLTASDPSDIETTFDALREGLRACEGDIPAGEEGPGTAEPMAVPDVGDDRYGTLTTMEEAGGGAYWLLHSSLVRQGSVLMELQVVDIVVGGKARPLFTTEDIDTFVSTAVERLPES